MTEQAGAEALVKQAAKDRKRYRRIIVGLGSVVCVLAVLGGGFVLVVTSRFDAQDQSDQTADCRAALNARYDDQLTAYLDAIDGRNMPARVTARENMRRINVARSNVTVGYCPSVTIVAVPPLTTPPSSSP